MANKEILQQYNQRLGNNNVSLSDVLENVRKLPEKFELQDKTIEITENGTINVEADEGFEGLNSVEITTNIESGGGASLFTGHVDVEGLRTIGWTDEDINYFQQYGVTWNEEEDDLFKLTPEELTGNYTNTSRFLPKRTAENRFSGNPYLIAVPNIDASSYPALGPLFQNCRNLKSVPGINKGNLNGCANLFNNCYSITKIPQLEGLCNTVENMFENCYSLETIPLIDTINATDFSSMFYCCYSLKTIPHLNTTNNTTMNSMFRNCYSLQTIPELDCHNVTNLVNCFSGNEILTNIGGFKNIGEAYLTSQSANNNAYTIGLQNATRLTHKSLMNIINNLYDIAAKGCNTQKLTLGSTNLAKLTAEEIAIATNKGWTVS